MTQERETGQSGYAVYDEDRGEHRMPIAPADGPIELNVSNSSGEVSVQAGDDPEAIVRFRKVSGRGNDTELVIELNKNRIKIEPRSASGWGGRLSGMLRDHGSYDISVELPRASIQDGSARVRVQTASGDVVVDEIPGEVRVNTASGDARVSGAAGQITLQTASGDMSLVRPRGQVTVHTASGDIDVDQGVLSRFAVATASGDARLTAELTGNESSNIQTVSGDVWLQIEGIVVSELRYATVSGDATVEGTFRKVATRTWRMGESEGGPKISVKTVSGDLHVDGRQTAGSTEPIRSPERAGDTAPMVTALPIPPTLPTPPTPPMPAQPAQAVQAGSPEETATPPRPIDGPPAEIGEVDAVVPEAVNAAMDETERFSVLQALERGEIDIEEAMNRLDKMDDTEGV